MDAVMRPDAPMRLESGDYKFDELLTHPKKLLTFITSDGKHIDVPVGSIRHSVTLYNCLQGIYIHIYIYIYIYIYMCGCDCCIYPSSYLDSFTIHRYR